MAGSAQERVEIEALKSRWAGCDPSDPMDPHRVLDAVVSKADAEWWAELAGQKAQRDAIVGAELAASKDVQASTAAMVEAVGQSWVAGQLLDVQREWAAGHYVREPSAALRAQLASDLAAAQAAVAAQLDIVTKAAADARSQAGVARAARSQAGDIAAAAGVPYGRGLLYAMQSAQVTVASAAAAQAAVGVVQTALSAVQASAADAGALAARAQAQVAAAAAEFHRVAAQDAAEQARMAAAVAGEAAAKAKAAAGAAATARAAATDADAAATAASRRAHEQRLVAEAESERAVAARKKAVAESERAAAAEQEAEARKADAASAHGCRRLGE